METYIVVKGLTPEASNPNLVWEPAGMKRKESWIALL